MNNYPTLIKEKLYSLIDDIADVSWLYCTNPGHNFIRNRKLDFATTMKLIIAMEGGTVSEEMMEFFNYDLTSPTPSAFNQQRSHIKPEAFYQIFSDFVSAFPGTKYLDNYQILACDGSNVVYATNPFNTEDFVKPRKKDDKGYNQLHLNALYDIINRTYIDAIIQPGVKQNEHSALHSMLEHFDPVDPAHVILTVDRGYESYNLIAQLQRKNMRFVIRAKDFTSCKCILSSFKEEYPDTPEFDVEINRFITRCRNKIQDTQPDIYLEHKADKTFDYASAHATGKDRLCYISFRVVRIKLSEDSYECIITNLPAYEFSPERIKELYHMRWGIETSFRQLKYAIGMQSFHAKKVEYVKQEIFAKLIVYNFSE
ncbi:MAG: IS4 family transposase, partial [Agathobacter sp.]